MKVIGVDPAIAKGKPIAIVTLELTSTDAPKIVGVVDETSLSGSLWEKYKLWRFCLALAIKQQQPDLVAIEEACGLGGKGSAHLRTLVTLLKERCKTLGVPVVLVNNQQAKSAMSVSWPATAEKIADSVRLLVHGAYALPATKGYDYEAAVSVALAGEGLWRQKQMREE